ncbi:MAG TPA: MFS transporter [Acidobacteriota bacterium]|nr:MFS transporter [Acidobacteriota bacterium]
MISRPWVIVALLVVALVINFVDRGNLSVAAPVLAPELGINDDQLGTLFSAFFLTYAICQIGVGWLSDRFEVKWVYAAGFLLWGLASMGHALAGGFAGLLAMRFALGVGESVTYPATSRILAAAIPEHRRGLANSLVDAVGARIGPALGILVGTWIISWWGWRFMFIAIGGIGLLWLVPWIIFMPRMSAERESARKVTEQKPSIRWQELVTHRAFWGTCGGLMGANYAWYFLLTWLPSYLVNERGFSLASMGLIGSFPFLIMVIPSLGAGMLADWLIARGGSPIRVRKFFLSFGLLLTSILLPLTLIPQVEFGVAALFAASFALGIYASNLFALTQSLAGAEAAGRWTGLQNACGNIPGIIAPFVTGWIVQTTGQYFAAFIAAGVACLIGSACFGLLIREGDELAPVSKGRRR